MDNVAIQLIIVETLLFQKLGSYAPVVWFYSNYGIDKNFFFWLTGGDLF